MCPQSLGLVQSNPANKTNGRFPRSYSRFDESLSYRLYNTLRYGDLTPSFEMEGVQSDEISLNSRDLIDSLSLKAPFKGSIRKIKESFMVPNMAILPRNWDRIYTPPTNGDDVPLDANCVLFDFRRNFLNFFIVCDNLLYSNIVSSSSSASDLGAWLTALLRLAVLGEYVYSAGSLLHVSGFKCSDMWHYKSATSSVLSYDQWFDTLVSTAFKEIQSFNVNIPIGNSVETRSFYGLSSAGVNTRSATFRSLLETFRENPLCWIIGSSISVDTTIGSVCSNINTNLSTFILSTNFHYTFPASDVASPDETDMYQDTLNLSRIFAYQLVCSHFHTNSSIDFIYTAELFRQYCRYFVDVVRANQVSPGWNDEFTWNSLSCKYDDLSGHLICRGLYYDSSSTPAVFSFTYAQFSANGTLNSTPDLARLALFAAIFGFRKSLRYADYFVGSRPRPLAPINTDVAVSTGNTVSVIDITRRIQAQRFANSVMRTRSKIEEYVKGLFGSSPAPDYHNPFYLSREIETIFGDEVQNTANTQVSDANSRTSNFASNLGRYTFTFHNEDEHPCIYLQIISFDMKRAYSTSVDRQFLIVDRFDLFNPFYQFIGDQPIYGVELGFNTNPGVTGFLNRTVGYTSRDMEYKQRFDQASGGFIDNLPGWALLANDRSHYLTSSLSPDFIRSFNVELDQFFLSLSGYSLGSYFHFICITDNNVDAKRAMVVDPQILG